jgi:Holliday junction resolvase RusA-like endonuclease
MVLSEEGRAYKLQALLLAKAKKLRPTEAKVSVELRFFRPRKAGDLDNRIKGLLDALIGVAWDDDDQVVEIHAYRADDKEQPRVEVVVTELH